MTGKRFESLLEEAFNPFLSELGLKPERPHLSGRYYRVNFVGKQHTLVVSFEPGDAYLSVILVRNDSDDLAAIDNPQTTPRLSDLNRRYMSEVTSSERADNEAWFSTIKVEDPSEQRLLKCAKDLRLVLPRHLRTESSR